MTNKKNHNLHQDTVVTEPLNQNEQNAQTNVGRRTRSISSFKGKIQLKQNNQSSKNKTTPNKTPLNKLKILFTIVARNKAEFYIDLIQSFEVNMQIAVLANGMAPKSIMELLGLASNEKVVIVSVIQETKVSDALAAIDEKFHTIKDGKGIAFTVPMTSLIGTLIYGFLSNNKLAVKEEKSK